MTMDLTAIGVVRSPLTDAASSPKQGDEGAPEATIVLAPHVLPALEGIGAGDRVLVLTWFDRTDRAVLELKQVEEPITCPVPSSKLGSSGSPPRLQPNTAS